MKIEQTHNEIIISDTPGCLWFVGLFFTMISGIFVYGSLGGFTNYKDYSPWVIGLTFLMGAIGIGVGIWLIYNAPITKIVLNRTDETVFMTRFGLFGKRETVYSFDEIQRFCLVEEKDDEGSNIWSVGMILTNGETIKITSLPSHSEEYERKYVFQTNEFMYKQIPSFRDAFELEGES